MKTLPSATRSAGSNSGSLQIRTAETSADWQIAHQWLDEEHLLGAGREAGDRLCQFILQDGEIVAVLIWCAAAWHLKDRDKMIGWDPVARSQRLKLVVQLRRFLILEKTRRPNLASQSLGLGLRELSARWFTEHGYRPLMAESFSDPESHHGTVYKITHWNPDFGEALISGPVDFCQDLHTGVRRQLKLALTTIKIDPWVGRIFERFGIMPVDALQGGGCRFGLWSLEPNSPSSSSSATKEEPSA